MIALDNFHGDTLARLPVEGLHHPPERALANHRGNHEAARERLAMLHHVVAFLPKACVSDVCALSCMQGSSTACSICQPWNA